jgi:hypothetical protein
MRNDVNGTAEDLAIEAKVEAMHALSPKEKVGLVKRVIARLQELRADAPWLAAFFDDLHSDTYPVCGRTDCQDCRDEGVGSCAGADDVARNDRLVADMAGLSCLFSDDLHDELGSALDLGEGVLDHLERRLRKAPSRPSKWVERAHAAREPRPTPPPAEPERKLTVEEMLESLTACRQNVANMRRIHNEGEREMLRQIDEQEAELRAEAGLPPRPDPVIDQLAEIRALDEDAYQRMAKLILEVHAQERSKQKQ